MGACRRRFQKVPRREGEAVGACAVKTRKSGRGRGLVRRAFRAPREDIGHVYSEVQRRYGEIWGDMGRYGEYSEVRSGVELNARVP